MKESAIHKAVMAHWRAKGKPDTLVATIPNMGAMGQYGLTPGLPDLMVLSPKIGVGFIELKAGKNKPSAHQKAFADNCEKLGIPHRFTWGRDEPIAVLEEWDVVRRPVSAGDPDGDREVA